MIEFSYKASTTGVKSLILHDMKMTFILCPGIIISREPSPEDTFSRMMTAPSYPNAIYNRFPIQYMVFSSSTVRMWEDSFFTSSSMNFGGSGFLRGSSARVLMIPTIFVIGLITMFCVSFEKVSEATVRITQVNNVVPN